MPEHNTENSNKWVVSYTIKERRKPEQERIDLTAALNAEAGVTIVEGHGRKTLTVLFDNEATNTRITELLAGKATVGPMRTLGTNI